MNRPKTTTVLKVAFTLLIVGLAILALTTQLSDSGDALRDVDALDVAGSLGLASLSLLTSSIAWSRLTQSMEPDLSTSDAVPFFLFSQLGKYLPGGMGPALAQSSLAGSINVSKTAAASAYVVFAAQTVVVGLVVAVVVLPFADPALIGEYWWAWAAGLAAVPLLHPRVFHSIFQFLIDKVRKGVELPRIEGRSALGAASWTVATWLLLGLHVAVLSSSFTDLDPSLVFISIGGYCLAWVAGFVILFLPAGLGAREVVLTAALATVFDTADAAVIAVLLRVIGVLSDVFVGLIAGAVLGLRSAARRSPRVQN